MILLIQLVLTSSMISVSTVVSLPCVTHDCIDPVGFDKQHDIGEYCGLITVLLMIVLTQLVLTSSMISVSTVVSLPCVTYDCIDPVGFDKQHNIGEYCGLVTLCFS